MLEIDAVLYEYVKSIHVIYTDLFLFSGFNRFIHFLSTYANSWIKIAARQNIIWIRFGNRRSVRRRRTEAGMALTAIGEITQWGGVAGCSGSRTLIIGKKWWFPWSLTTQRLPPPGPDLIFMVSTFKPNKKGWTRQRLCEVLKGTVQRNVSSPN